MKSAAIALAVATSLGLAACHQAREPANASADSAPTGASGKGNVASDGSATARPGTGLGGGLGATRSMGANASPAASASPGMPDEGSTNRTTRSSVGNR